MTTVEFVRLLREAYAFPDYASDNLDSAEEILEEMREEANVYRLDIEPFFRHLFAEAEHGEAMLEMMKRHFLK